MFSSIKLYFDFIFLHFSFFQLAKVYFSLLHEKKIFTAKETHEYILTLVDGKSILALGM